MVPVAARLVSWMLNWDCFWSKTATDTGCVVWQGAQNSKGYGCFGVGGRPTLAHRLAWEDANGAIPDGMTIDHLETVTLVLSSGETVKLGTGLPAAGQSDLGMKHLVGHCVNLLALRSRIDEEKPFIEHLKARRTGVLDAFDNQKYTFGTLLRKSVETSMLSLARGSR